MSLPKGRSNSGINNLISFPKGKSGYSHSKRNVLCVQCGSSFITTGPFAKYCSGRCKELSRPDSQKKEFTCKFCGKSFKRKAKDNAGKFCSRQCSGLWTTANGDNNYFYKAFLYLPHKCDKCGNGDFSVLAVHHKDKNKYNNELSNLQILCANCHYKIHYGNGTTRYLRIIPILEYLKKGGCNESFA